MKLCPHPMFLLLSVLQNVTCPAFSTDYSLEAGGLMYKKIQESAGTNKDFNLPLEWRNPTMGTTTTSDRKKIVSSDEVGLEDEDSVPWPPMFSVPKTSNYPVVKKNKNSKPENKLDKHSSAETKITSALLEKNVFKEVHPTEAKIINVTDSQIKFGEPEINVTDSQIKFEEPEINVTDSQIRFTEAKINVTDSQIKFTNPEINLTDTQIKFTNPEINLTDKQIKFTKPESIFTDTKINFTQPEINFTKPKISVILENKMPTNSLMESINITGPMENKVLDQFTELKMADDALANKMANEALANKTVDAVHKFVAVPQEQPMVTVSLEKKIENSTVEHKLEVIHNKNRTDNMPNNIFINIVVNAGGGKVSMTVSNTSMPPMVVPDESAIPLTTAASLVTTSSTIRTTIPPILTTRPTVPTTTTRSTTTRTTTTTTTEAPIVSTATPQSNSQSPGKTTKRPNKLETILSTPKPANISKPNKNPCDECPVVEMDDKNKKDDEKFIIPKVPHKSPSPSPLPWELDQPAMIFPSPGFNRRCNSYFDCGFQVSENKSRTWLRCMNGFCSCELLGYVRDEESGWSLDWSKEAQACMSTWHGPCGFSRGLEIHCHLGCECGKESLCVKPGHVFKKPTTTTTTTTTPPAPVVKPKPNEDSDEDCEDEEDMKEEHEVSREDGKHQRFNLLSFLLFPNFKAVHSILNESLNSV